MLKVWREQLWHHTLGRPYRLPLALDHGQGAPVVFLHGIGASGNVWRHVSELLGTQSYRVLAPDLLGFGSAPKPQWSAYTADDHARSVILTLERLRLGRPVVLVGHSMGCLIAVRVARLRPDLVSHLILYQMPLYSTTTGSRSYTARRDLYFKMYRHLIEWPPNRTQSGLRRTIIRLSGLNITNQSWIPFTRSLQATIMKQSALQDMYQLRLPIDVIYGSLDMIVIRGKPRKLFAEVLAPLQTHTIVQLHHVSPRASKFIARRVAIAVTEDTEQAKLRRISDDLLRN